MKRLLAIALIGVFIQVGCKGAYKEVPIMDSVSLTNDWTEVRATEPSVQQEPQWELIFKIDSLHQRTPAADIRIGNQTFVPEVQLSTSGRKTIKPDSHGFLGEEMYFSWNRGSIGDDSIVAFRLRSSVPLKISRLVWRGYNPEDVKR